MLGGPRRLAEAFAEKLHELVRKELWGYAQDEALSGEDLLKVKYQVRCGPSRAEVPCMVAHTVLLVWCLTQSCLMRSVQASPGSDAHLCYRSAWKWHATSALHLPMSTEGA